MRVGSGSPNSTSTGDFATHREFGSHGDLGVRPSLPSFRSARLRSTQFDLEELLGGDMDLRGGLGCE